jgi:hypothetical protein
MPLIIEDFHEFANRQRMKDGSIPRRVIADSRVSPRTGESVVRTLFENGAVSFGPTSHRDPPTDPIALLQARRAFYAAAEAVEVHDWERFRADCVEQSELHKRFGNLPGINQRAVELLIAGSRRIAAYRQQLADIDARLADAPQQRVMSAEEQRLQAMRRQQKEEEDRLAAAVRSLSV